MLLNFDFSRTQCLNGGLFSTSGSALVGSMQANGTRGGGDGGGGFCNAHGDGLLTASSLLVSTSSIASLQQALAGGNGGYAVALWLQQAGDFTGTRTIFSIESQGGSSAASIRAGACAYNVKLVMTDSSTLEVQLCESRSDVVGTFYSPAYAGTSSVDLRATGAKIRHLALSFAAVNAIPSISLYLDGSLLLSWVLPAGYSGKYLPSGWTSLFSLVVAPQYWPGSFYSLSLFSSAQSPADVMALYRLGLPNSLPVAQSAMLVVQENGEAGDHSLDPAFYDVTPIPATSLIALALPAFDGDDLPSSPNYNPLKRMRVWLQRLPFPRGSGTLYFLNGTALSSCPVAVPYDAASDSYLLRFRPALDVYSRQ